MLEVLPGEGAAALRLGMTQAEAERAVGRPQACMRNWLQLDHWSWYDAALQVEFDADDRIGEVSVNWIDGTASATFGGIDLFQKPADEVVERLEDVLGPGVSDGRGYEHEWPDRRFGLWRATPPAAGNEDFRRGLYWMSASTYTDGYAREVARRTAVRRDDLVG
jgi:hypothetical protein